MFNVIFHSLLYKKYIFDLSGKKFSAEKGITCNNDTTECLQYNDRINPSVTNDFSHGSFRALHACIPPQVHLYSKDGRRDAYNLTDIIGISDMLDSKYNEVLEGMLRDPIYCEMAGYSDEVICFAYLISDVTFSTVTEPVSDTK